MIKLVDTDFPKVPSPGPVIKLNHIIETRLLFVGLLRAAAAALFDTNPWVRSGKVEVLAGTNGKGQGSLMSCACHGGYCSGTCQLESNLATVG